MEVSIIFKIGAVGILVSVLSQILKHSGREEQAFLVSFSGLLLVLFWIVPYIYELLKISSSFLYCRGGKNRGYSEDFCSGNSGVLLGILLKDRAPEYVSLVTMGIGLVILGLAVGKISYLFQSLERLKQSLPIDGSYITTLLKMIGITYIGQFSSGICRDAGYSSTGAQIELFCRLSVMVLSMPVLLALLDTIQGFLA